MASVQQIAVPLLRLLPEWQPSLQFVRFRKRINIQRPFHPHFARDKVLHVCKPIFPALRGPTSVVDLCQKQLKINQREEKVDNPYERLIARDILNWFKHSNMVAFIHINPITEEEKFKVNIALKKQNMSFKPECGRKMMRMALENTEYEPVVDLFQSHTAIVFSVEPQVAKLLQILKKVPQLVIMAGIVDNRLLSKNEMVRYSQLPDLQMTRAHLVSTLNLAANQVLQHLTHHQSTLVGHLKQHIEQQEKESKTDQEGS